MEYIKYMDGAAKTMAKVTPNVWLMGMVSLLATANRVTSTGREIMNRKKSTVYTAKALWPNHLLSKPE
jgi:hypothetical protein